MRRLHVHVGTLIGHLWFIGKRVRVVDCPGQRPVRGAARRNRFRLRPSAPGEQTQRQPDLYPRPLFDQTIFGNPLRVVVRPAGVMRSIAIISSNSIGQYAEGVYLWVNGQVWGPEQVPAGRRVNVYTQISSTLTGSGTASDPWVVTNVLGVGSTGCNSPRR